MRSHARRAVSVAFIGTICALALVAPAQVRVRQDVASERRNEPQLTAVATATALAPALTPRVVPFDLGVVSGAVLAAFSFAFATRARQRLSPCRLVGIRALGYGRRGPPLAPA